MGYKEDSVLGDKKRFEQILTLLSLGQLGSYLQLMKPCVVLSQISHLILLPFPQTFPNSPVFSFALLF